MKTKILLTVILIINVNIAICGDSVWISYANYVQQDIVPCIVADRNNIKWIGTYSHGLYKFDGNTWTHYDTSNSGLTSNYILSSAVDSNNFLWLGLLDKGLVRYNGYKWMIYDSTNTGLNLSQVVYIGVDNKNNIWICTGAAGLIKYDHSLWTLYNTSNSGLPKNTTKCITFEDSIKWIAIEGGGIARFDNINWTVYKTTNSGIPSNFTEGIAIDSNKNIWVSTFQGGIAKFNYYNNIWTVYNIFNSGLPSNNTYRIIVDKKQAVWIGTTGGIAKFYITYWVVYRTDNSVLPSNTISAVYCDKYNNIWVGTWGGLATYYSNGLINVNNYSSSVEDFELLQNYPNPFNNSSKIKFTVYKSADIKINVFNILGKKIETLVDKVLQNGVYDVLINGNKYSSGIYFYSMFADNKKIDTKKFLLIK